MQIERYRVSKELIFLNLFLICFFLLITLISPFRATDELLLLTSDSQTYFSCGTEFFDLNAHGTSIVRPFLFPVIFRFLYFLGGAQLIVFFHFLCWTISAQLIYFGLKKSLNQKVAIIGLMLFIVNLSIISYAFHGLTELVSTLLLSILMYLAVTSYGVRPDWKLVLKILLILALLTVIKPLFKIPLTLCFLGALVYLRKVIWNKKKIIIYFFLILTPVLFQMTMMKFKYGKFTVSTIDSLTFNHYLFAQGIREIEKIESIPDSQEIADSMSGKTKYAYLIEHKSKFLKLYFTNIKENVDAYESNFFLTPEYTIDSYSNWMDKYNHVFFFLSLIILPVYLIQLFIDLFRKQIIDNWTFYLLSVLFYYIIFASGISFWQSDRLVIFALPLWIVFYCLFFYRVRNKMRKRLADKV